MSTEHEEAHAVSVLIAAALARRLARNLREVLPRGASMTYEELAVAVAAQAIPLLHTILIEDDPLSALDEQEALEELMGDA